MVLRPQKQIIVHDGSNIAPQEVEDALLNHPSVEAVGVIGVHDLLHGENVRAYVELKQDGRSPTAAELIQFARASVGYKAPEEIVLSSPRCRSIPPARSIAPRLKKMAAGDHAHHI